jgi:HD-like signal output (HDOD) protein
VSPLQFGCLILAVLALIVALGLSRSRFRRNPTQPSSVPVPTPVSHAPLEPAGTASATATPDESIEESSTRHEAMRRLQALALTSELPSAPADSAAHEELASKVRWSLATLADKPNYAPRRPLLLPKLVAAMNDDDVSRRELTRIIASDPALVGALLRLVNGSFYRTSPEPVESLDRAVALLGIDGMRALVAAALLQPVFQLDGGGFPRFGEITWAHTLSSAAAAESHAIMLESADPFAAQLLALLAGLATIVVFRIALDEYRSRKLAPDARTLNILLDSQTAPVARQICASWQLSPRMDAALADQNESRVGRLSALGRSLQFGRFLGALAVLHRQQLMGDAAVAAALQTGGQLSKAYERIWARRAR